MVKYQHQRFSLDRLSIDEDSPRIFFYSLRYCNLSDKPFAYQAPAMILPGYQCSIVFIYLIINLVSQEEVLGPKISCRVQRRCRANRVLFQDLLAGLDEGGWTLLTFQEVQGLQLFSGNICTFSYTQRCHIFNRLDLLPQSSQVY